MATKSLAQVVAEKPYTEFADWWPMGADFLAFMSTAIGEQWRAVTNGELDITAVQQEVTSYISLVYQRDARPALAADFLEGRSLSAIQSGEFDALSYAFYKSAFEVLAATIPNHAALREARHAFTQQVGKRFYDQLHEHLALTLPAVLQDAQSFAQLQHAVGVVGDFLQEQGYLRDHFAFHFTVNLHHGAQPISQKPEEVVSRLTQGEAAYALYEMGYPVILPSAVYLFQTMGEAQHHSSRTIEELFGRIGYVASETPDFDPTGYPSDMVVELWTIRKG
jgi:hypothetical protein